MDKNRSLPPEKGTDMKKRKDAPAQSRDGSRQQDGRSTPTTARSAKRVKFQDARNIRTQPSDAALEDGKLDLQKFLNAREFEINALEESMRKCKAANATRVFQQVPRAMRRRTASHNAKRVPKRLRERARREMIEDNTPTVEARKRRPRTTRARIRAETAKKLAKLAERKRKKMRERAAAEGIDTGGVEPKPTVDTRAARPKIRRNTLNEPPKPDSKFRKRQINKTWLPTHLWHAKRARMTEPSKPLWRFAIPLTPTEKCYRPTHRAAGQKGVVAWDMSYMSTIGLYGAAEGVERVLKALGLTGEGLWGARGQKWRAGVRKWTGILSRQTKEGSRRDIGPATIIWNPQAPAQGDDVTTSTRSANSQRQLFIRTHPSCFLELFQELRKLVKMQTPQLYIEDLRFEIGSIELIGPGSTEALLGILQPYHDGSDGEERHGQVFKSLAGVTNPASLPEDALLAFSVKDPRLAYPPKRVDLPAGGGDGSLVETLTRWPVEEGLKPFGIFSRDSRFRASRLPSQKAINRRKGANAPGEPLRVTPADPPIPVVLLASRPSTGGQAQGTWTLLAPWKCIMPLWYALMHYPLSTGGNPRLGGLDEQRQIAFEHGAPWFPADFPATDAGRNWELEQRAKQKQEWDRRPKGKRVEWKSLDLGAGRKGEIGNGFACDFEHLFGSSSAEEPPDRQATGPSIADGAEMMDIDAPDRSEETEVSEPLGAPAPSGLIQCLPKASFTSLLRSPNSETPPANSIITVNLTFVARGVANTCARIYRLPSRGSRVAEPSADAEVLATDPTPTTTSSRTLPRDLRDQWLRKLPQPIDRGQGSRSRLTAPPRMPLGVDMETRKRLLAQSIVETELPYPKPAPNELDIGGHHPLCPDEGDLLGFVTTGAFSLSEGKGTAIGSISAARALEAMREAGAREGKLCIVRNAGESVGWLARWELV
ncbi:hypothetical protein MYCTH_2297740 [Thermothelomyces thermophilus ATCC 42464]|uniref:POPLD domain-containing protein n=1 Tax=Thermothelomyces thermophilus (strain ATCC 42464 / BCRC 31852 / DSM 1799) TaxID=573729 RepID=G2Q6Y4_THET4|nr:uncharacterized protein MYCTH_2297740 [Thermothelomyces thermophilus ATCC 42464]AEO54764.1 hypothetical protein MYCTH_2297740 [Thermothelomyces thermophilus ATCC 42464]